MSPSKPHEGGLIGMTVVLSPTASTTASGNGHGNGHKTEPPLARPICLADLVDALVADAEETLRAAAEGRPRGAITGIPMLDAAMGHALQPGLHVWTGDPGSGKTALALQ